MRQAKIADVPRLVAIELLSQVVPWSQDIFERCLIAGYDCWVEETAGSVIGFVLMSSIIATGESHILNLCVDPDYQCKGMGQKLLGYAVSEANRKGMGIIYLEVRKTNHNAIRLYDKMDFVQIGERKNYYPTKKGREDALVFAKDLGVDKRHYK